MIWTKTDEAIASSASIVATAMIYLSTYLLMYLLSRLSTHLFGCLLIHFLTCLLTNLPAPEL